MNLQRLLTSSIDELEARERILRSALVLFNRHGAHRVSPDRIIEDAKVARMTFFRHFKSKAALVAECLHIRDEDFFERLQTASIAKSGRPQEAILGIFDALKRWMDEPDYRGSVFIRGLNDYPVEDDVDSGASAIVRGHFEKLAALVEQRLKAFRPKDYKTLTPQVLSLIAGSVVVSQATKSSHIAVLCKAAANKLLDQ